MKSERRLLKELSIIGKEIHKRELVIGDGGNISARKGDVVCIKKRSASMAAGKKSDYIPVSLKTGKPIGRGGLPSTEVPMHLACYTAREDIGAVMHTHPVFITALGVPGTEFKPLSYEAKVCLKSDIAAVAYIKPGSAELGRAVGKAIKKHNAVILKYHGLITVGKDAREAFLRTLAAERAALAHILRKMVSKLDRL